MRSHTLCHLYMQCTHCVFVCSQSVERASTLVHVQHSKRCYMHPHTVCHLYTQCTCCVFVYFPVCTANVDASVRAARPKNTHAPSCCVLSVYAIYLWRRHRCAFSTVVRPYILPVCTFMPMTSLHMSQSAERASTPVYMQHGNKNFMHPDIVCHLYTQCIYCVFVIFTVCSASVETGVCAAQQEIQGLP